MSKLRKLNVSEVEGNDNSIFPPGTVWIDQDNSLRISDGETQGGLPAVVGGADTGSFRFNNNFLYTQSNQEIWIDPSNDDGNTGFIYIPGPNEANVNLLQIGNQMAGGVRISSNNHNWTFGSTGSLTLPAGGTIVDVEGGGLTGNAIKLTPADGVNSGQALLIYPTTNEGDHIHLTAGANTTELYLGNDNHYVKLSNNGNVEISAGISPFVSGVSVDAADSFGEGVWRLFILDSTYPTIGTTVQIGGTVTTSWGTPVTATITDILHDIGYGRWIFIVDQDVTPDFSQGSSVDFGPGVETYLFGANGNLTIPGTISSYEHIFIDANYDAGYSVYIGNDHPSSGTLGGVVLGDVRGGFVNIVTTKLLLSETAVPATSAGNTGDLVGEFAVDETGIYYCKEQFTGHTSAISINSDQWGGAAGGYTTLPFLSEARAPQVGWTIDATFNSGPVSLTITDVVALGSNRYDISFNSVGEVNVSNGNSGTLTDNIPPADIWKSVSWNGQATVTLDATTENLAAGYTFTEVAPAVVFFEPDPAYMDSNLHVVYLIAPTNPGQKVSLISNYNGEIQVIWPWGESTNAITLQAYQNSELTAVKHPGQGLTYWETNRYSW